MNRRNSLARDRHGASSLEFALVALPYMLLVFAVIGGAILFWAKSTIQLAAAQTARCVALGSTDCLNRTSYATSVLAYWGADDILQTISVTGGSTCPNAAGQASGPGQYVSITISGRPGPVAQLVPDLAATMLTATACYPSGP